MGHTVLLVEILVLNFLIVMVHKSWSQGVCIISEDVNECPSTWSVNSPSINVTHHLILPLNSAVFVTYELALKNSTVLPICQYFFNIDGSCFESSGPNCIRCQNNYAFNRTVLSQFYIPDVDMTKNDSILRYDLNIPVQNDVPIRQFQISECEKLLVNAEAFNCYNNESGCGYGCMCRFRCIEPYINETLNLMDEYQCTNIANWVPQPPICVSEPTSTETPTTHTATTTSNGSTQGGGRAIHPNSGPCLAGIGGGLAAVCIGIFVYMAIISFDIPNKVTFYAMSVLCLVAWAVALGLCFGVSTNEAAVIAGIVVGSLALAGMVVIIGFQISLLKSHND